MNEGEKFITQTEVFPLTEFEQLNLEIIEGLKSKYSGAFYCSDSNDQDNSYLIVGSHGLCFKPLSGVVVPESTEYSSSQIILFCKSGYLLMEPVHDIDRLVSSGTLIEKLGGDFKSFLSKELPSSEEDWWRHEYSIPSLTFGKSGLDIRIVSYKNFDELTHSECLFLKKAMTNAGGMCDGVSGLEISERAEIILSHL